MRVTWYAGAVDSCADSQGGQSKACRKGRSLIGGLNGMHSASDIVLSRKEGFLRPARALPLTEPCPMRAGSCFRSSLHALNCLKLAPMEQRRPASRSQHPGPAWATLVWHLRRTPQLLDGDTGSGKQARCVTLTPEAQAPPLGTTSQPVQARQQGAARVAKCQSCWLANRDGSIINHHMMDVHVHPRPGLPFDLVSRQQNSSAMLAPCCYLYDGAHTRIQAPLRCWQGPTMVHALSNLALLLPRKRLI